MSNIKIRKPVTGDLPALRDIWRIIFGSLGEEAFFLHFFEPGLCVIVEADNKPAAAGYLVPFGDVVSFSDTIPCAMIYSIATLPEFRGLGFGRVVVSRLITLAYELGYPAVVLCPVEDELFEYYSTRSNLIDRFYVREYIFKSGYENNTCIAPVCISIDEYITKREELLKDIVHIRHDFKTLEYQVMLCNESGGGLFRIGDFYAVVERQTDKQVWIKELLVPGLTAGDKMFDNIAAGAVASLSGMFPADEYTVRFPTKTGQGRRFGMIAFSDDKNDIIRSHDFSPWYGMAFD